MTEVPEHADKTGGGETPQDMNQHPTLTETASPGACCRAQAERSSRLL